MPGSGGTIAGSTKIATIVVEGREASCSGSWAASAGSVDATIGLGEFDVTESPSSGNLQVDVTESPSSWKEAKIDVTESPSIWVLEEDALIAAPAPRDG